MTAPGWNRPLRRNLMATLLDWDARDLSLVARTGQTGVFARAGSAVLKTANGLTMVPRGLPRYQAWGGDFGMLLERATTNLITASENFGSWTAVGSPTRTTGQRDPFGGTAASKLADTAGGTAEGYYLAVTFTGNATKAVSLFLKADTATETVVSVFDNTAGTNRHQVKVTWTAGVPSLSTVAGSGTLCTPELIADGWWWIGFTASSVTAANANRVYIYPSGVTAASTGAVYAFGAQAEDSLYPTSYVATNGGTASRMVEGLKFPVAARPQAITWYVDLVDLGTQLDGASSLAYAQFGVSTTNPRLTLLATSASNLRLYHHNGTSTSQADVATTTPNFGQRAELCGVIGLDGALTVHRAVEGASPGTGTPVAGSEALRLPTAWSAAFLHLNGLDGVGTSGGAALYRKVLVVQGAMTFDQMRQLAR